MTPTPTIAVLGASGLIGEFIASTLSQNGFPVVAIGRHFQPSQKAQIFGTLVERSVVTLAPDEIARVLSENRVDIVVNCIGVLQSTPLVRADLVHRDFVNRLVKALAATTTSQLLIHISIPGDQAEDKTEFSRSKREAEQAVRSGPSPFIILRPGCVIAPSAYGGSALVRGLAALPFDLPDRESAARFATTDVRDIAKTIERVAKAWAAGQRSWRETWDVMAPEPTTVRDVVAVFRHRFGGPARTARIPSWLLDCGAVIGDALALLGWRPSIRRTVLAELRRGVAGDPAGWIAATGIDPIRLDASVRSLSASIQEKWFARLYLLKPLALGTLAIFWIVSGALALTVSFRVAAKITASLRIFGPLSTLMTTIAALADIVVGVAIATKPLSRAGLIGGIVLSTLYLAVASFLAPSMWVDPLGPMIKVVPVIGLMLVAIAIGDSR